MISKELEKIVSQGIGEASVLWSETPTGIFESTKNKKSLKKKERRNISR